MFFDLFKKSKKFSFTNFEALPKTKRNYLIDKEITDDLEDLIMYNTGKDNKGFVVVRNTSINAYRYLKLYE